MEIDLTGLVLPEKVEAIRLSEDGRRGEFVIEPLERGFGHTLGNAVRRVLLSSLRGAAVWAFRTEGVVHEHQTIQGVVEDAHQVIQNLKSLIVVLDDDVDAVTLEVAAKGAGPVTAGDIREKAGVRVLNPDHLLLTLQDKRALRLELRVNKGRGFVLADQHELDKGESVDLVRIDSIYNPVRRCNFEVLETRVGQRTDFDQLTFSVETDGSVSPEEALATAAKLVRKHLDYLLHLAGDGAPAASPAGAVPLSETIRELIGRSLEDLPELSVRCRNSLQKENIRTLADLIQKSRGEMLRIDNFGQKSLKEIEDFLQGHGLAFGMKLAEGDDGQLFLVGEEAGAGVEAEGE